MNFKINNIYIKVYKSIFNILPKKFKNRFIKIQLLIIMTSIIDIFGLASIIPVLSLIADKEALNSNSPIAKIKNFTGIDNPDYFLLFLFIISFLFLILRSLFIFFSYYQQNRFSFSLGEYIGKKTYNYYLNLDFEDFSKKDNAQILRELTSGPQQFTNFLVNPFLLINSESFVLLAITIGIAYYNLQVFIILVLTMLPISYIFQKLVKNKVSSYGVTKNNYLYQLITDSNRASNGYADVKLRNKENKLIDSYSQSFENINIIGTKSNVLKIVPSKLFELSAIGGLIIIFVYGTFITNNSDSIYQLIMIFAAAGYRVIPSLGKLSPAFMSLEQYKFLIDIYEVPLKSTIENTELFNKSKISFENKIVFQNVNFSYKNTNVLVLENINLTLKKGEIIGLVGKSGSGKTTLVKLLAGFLKPVKGKITVDGINLLPENTSSWMHLISYVQQSPYLEKGNLSKNIAFLEDDIDEIRLINAIKKSSLESLLGEKSPYEFFVDENGKNLSGGQKQRIIIARALYHQSNLIILDEATSSLDNVTESEINETVSQLKGTGVTVVIIAHRTSTLKHTDRILQMEDGKICNEIKFSEIKLTN